MAPKLVCESTWYFVFCLNEFLVQLETSFLFVWCCHSILPEFLQRLVDLRPEALMPLFSRPFTQTSSWCLRLKNLGLRIFRAPFEGLWWICVSACVRYGGSGMVQILGHTLKNWLLIMHGWPCLSNQAMDAALPICCLGT